MPQTPLATPLAGIRVLEFSHTVMGPTAGLVFAELGADVIKIEPAPHGDHTRGLGGFGAWFFAAFNRNKRSLAVDLKREEGRAVIHRLIPTTDAILENFGPGTMERLGCGYEQLAALKPRLVYLALKGYLAGPYEHRPALDEVVQFQTGLAFMTGPPGQPLRAGASVIDMTGAIFGVVAAQAALRERDTTGKGQRVSSALFESAAFLMSTHMAGMAATGLEARPMPARRGAAPGRSTRFSRPRVAGSCSSASPATSNGRGSSRNSDCTNWAPTLGSRPMSCGSRNGLG
jgi:crotonobetainyl-CoA:carnitine CoA-transferase CaiB-like acyl-CoA transferase